MFKRNIIIGILQLSFLLFISVNLIGQSDTSVEWKKVIIIDGYNDAFPSPLVEDIVGKAKSVTLPKGIYLIKHKGGGIYYDLGRKVNPVPMVFVYSYDKEKVINLVTRSWMVGTLNRKGDVFIVKVKESYKKIYFFIVDNYIVDNAGQITIEITKL